MRFFSTANRSNLVSLKEAVESGLAPDNGLYMPERIPTLGAEFIGRLGKLSLTEIASEIAGQFIESDIPRKELDKIVGDAINFPAPLAQVSDNIFALELFHGPTLAFKDFGARFMARLLSWFRRDEPSKLTVLVATSGDTGSAVAHGFLGLAGFEVVILYPSGKVSKIQEQQLTTLGQNITAREVSGTFDDCQSMVKEAFLDRDLLKIRPLTSANSINIARLIPQIFYYFGAVSELVKLGASTSQLIVSVPSGNFGDLTAGLIAKRMGLPITRFVASTNRNDVVPEYLETGVFRPRPSVLTPSNAMDVGNPSNFARMLDLYGGSVDAMKKEIHGSRHSDEETLTKIADTHRSTGYILDPHGAVGLLGLEDYLKAHPGPAVGVFFETAHPAKFLDVVSPIVGNDLKVPERLRECLDRKKQSTKISNRYEDLRRFLSS